MPAAVLREENRWSSSSAMRWCCSRRPGRRSSSRWRLPPGGPTRLAVRRSESVPGANEPVAEQHRCVVEAAATARPAHRGARAPRRRCRGPIEVEDNGQGFPSRRRAPVRALCHHAHQGHRLGPCHRQEDHGGTCRQGRAACGRWRGGVGSPYPSRSGSSWSRPDAARARQDRSSPMGPPKSAGNGQSDEQGHTDR